jgi:hypothetical protein
MIIEFLLDMIFNVVSLVLNLFPALPSFDVAGLSGFLDLLSKSAVFVPYDTFLSCMATWFAFYNVELFWSIIEWVYKKIPGVD